jgi:hypothetical protein
VNEDNQTVVPRSFMALFVPPGRVKPTEPWAVIAERHELCEDMAQMLTEVALGKRFELGVTEEDVLGRIGAGLLEGGIVSADEAGWVISRLAELLNWR